MAGHAQFYDNTWSKFGYGFGRAVETRRLLCLALLFSEQKNRSLESCDLSFNGFFRFTMNVKTGDLVHSMRLRDTLLPSLDS